MTSGTSKLKWVRPLRRIVCLFDGQVVPFAIDGLESGHFTEGHRFMGDGQPFLVKDFEHYREGLERRYVVLDPQERKDRIVEAAKTLAFARNLELVEDAGLLEEVAGLVEWPVPVLGDMDPAFLDLPPEVIRTSMRTHQKYFAVRDPKTGRLAARFLVVSNIEAPDGGKVIAAGNSKVLSARLSDARFFWDEDIKAGFDAWLAKLSGVTFHAKLGTMAQRVERMVALAKHIAPLFKADADVAAEAARLAKADLASKMVGEFPELQGIMGGYYADALKLPADIANAIREHYKPQGPSDSVPENAVSASVALADKIDTLVGFFAIDEKPTGSKDPYALRRAALGTLRILREHDARLSIGELVQAWYAHLGGDVPAHFRGYEGVRAEILDFFNDRLKVQLKDEGQRFDVLDAVLAEKDNDVVRVTLKVAALDAALIEFGEDLLAVHKRAANILTAEAKKGALPDGEPQVLDGSPAIESDLINELKVQKNNVTGFLAQENYLEVLKSVAAMRQTVDAFLDGVLVNSDDSAERANRLRVLKAVCDLSAPVADLSKIV
jgi:glycyl-tRNA synthetase beta chain